MGSRNDAQVEPLERVGRYSGSSGQETTAQIEAQDAIFRDSDPDRQLWAATSLNEPPKMLQPALSIWPDLFLAIPPMTLPEAGTKVTPRAS